MRLTDKTLQEFPQQLQLSGCCPQQTTENQRPTTYNLRLATYKYYQVIDSKVLVVYRW